MVAPEPPDRLPIMLMKIVSLVGAALLVTAGCAGSDSGADNAGGKPSPTATVLPQKLTKPGPRPDLAPQDSPAADASFAEQLEYELQTRTLTMAHAQGKTTATCPSGMESSKGTKTTCTTTFNGLKVQWTVTIGDKADWSYDGGYVQYEATPSTGILTRDGVARLFFGNYSDADYLLCNNIPAAALVPLNAQSKYKCQVVFKGEKPGYADPVRATEHGPRSY